MSSTVTIIDHLRATPLLAQLDDALLQRVAAGARRVPLSADAWLFRQGDPARHFYLLESGRLRLFRLSPEGGEKIVEFVAPGETFAEALMFLNAPRYPVCAAALEPSQVLRLDAADFAAMLRESVDACFVLLGSLSMRLRGLIGEIDTLTLHDARSRMARYLLSQCPPDQRAFVLDVRKSALASRLSIQPETLSRVMRQLSAESCIAVHGARLTLLDRAALCMLAGIDDLGQSRASP